MGGSEGEREGKKREGGRGKSGVRKDGGRGGEGEKGEEGWREGEKVRGKVFLRSLWDNLESSSPVEGIDLGFGSQHR